MDLAVNTCRNGGKQQHKDTEEYQYITAENKVPFSGDLFLIKTPWYNFKNTSPHNTNTFTNYCQ